MPVASDNATSTGSEIPGEAALMQILGEESGKRLFRTDPLRWGAVNAQDMLEVKEAVVEAMQGDAQKALKALNAHPSVLRTRRASDVRESAQVLANAFQDSQEAAARVLDKYPSLLSTPAETMDTANTWLISTFGYLQAQQLIKRDPFMLAQTPEFMAAMTPGGSEDPEKNVWADESVVARDGVARGPSAATRAMEAKQRAEEEEHAAATAARAMIDPNSAPARRSRELTQLKMADLKSLGKLYDVKIGGKKSDLVARLVAYEMTDEGAARMEELMAASTASSAESAVQQAQPLGEEGDEKHAATRDGRHEEKRASSPASYRPGITPLVARADGKPFDAVKLLQTLDAMVESSAKRRAIGMSVGAVYRLNLKSLAYKASDADVREVAEQCADMVWNDSVSEMGSDNANVPGGGSAPASEKVKVKFVRVKRDRKTKRALGEATVELECAGAELADAVAAEMRQKRIHGRRVHVDPVQARASAGAFEDAAQEREARCAALSNAVSATYERLALKLPESEGGFASYPFDARSLRVEIDFISGRLLVAGRRHDRVTDEVVSESDETARALTMISEQAHQGGFNTRNPLVRAYRNALDDEVNRRADVELEKSRAKVRDYIGSFDELVGQPLKVRCVGFVDAETRRVEKLPYGTWRFVPKNKFDHDVDWKSSWMKPSEGREAAGILFDVLTPPPPSSDGSPPPTRLPRGFLKRSSFTRSMRFEPGETYQVLLTGVYSGAKSAPLSLTQQTEDFPVALIERYLPELRDGLIEVVDVGRVEGVLTKVVLALGPNARDVAPDVHLEDRRATAGGGSKHDLSKVDPLTRVLSTCGDVVMAVSAEMHREIIDLVPSYDRVEDQVLSLLRMDPAVRKDDLIWTHDNEYNLVVSPEEHRTLVRGAAAHLKLTERMANVSLNLKVDEQRTDVDVLRGGRNFKSKSTRY